MSPLSRGFFEFGIPWCGKVSLKPGLVGPPRDTVCCRPSMVVTVRCQPVSASLRSGSIVAIRLSPSRVNVGCGFYDVLLAFCEHEIV